MKFLLFALDAASAEAVIDLDEQVKRAGHRAEVLVYNHNKDFQTSIAKRYDALGISNFTSRAAMPVGARGFFTNKRFRQSARFWDRWLAGFLYLLLRLIQPILALVKNNGAGVLGRNGFHILSYFFTLQADIVTAEDILTEHEIDVLLLSHDFVGHFSSVLAQQARKKNIPIVLVPALFTEPDKALVMYKDRPELQVETRLEACTAKKWPQWVRTLPTGRKLLRLEWWRIVLLERSALAPPQPWVHQMCESDLVCLPDEILKEEYIALGFEPEKIVVVGNSVQDKLRHYKKETARRDGKPVLLVALPPDQFTGANMGFRHDSFTELVEELKTVLLRAKEHFQILLSVHPKEASEKYEGLAQAGFSFAEKPTIELLSSADVYLSYAGSSTNNWAYWARVPCVHWDPFNYVKGVEGRQNIGAIYALNTAELCQSLDHLAKENVRANVYADFPPEKTYCEGESYFDRILTDMASNRLF